MYVPPLVQYMIDAHGWRAGYYCLALIALLITLPLIALFLRDPTSYEEVTDTDAKPEESPDYVQPGMSISEVLVTREMWLLFGVFSLVSFCLYGLYFHLVPMLIDRGINSRDAARIASSVGATVIIARVTIGYLVDRFFAPRVAIICFLLTVIGLVLLANGAMSYLAYLAAVFIGFSMGVEMDLLAYLASRYFGLKNYGQVYGALFVSFLLGASLGPICYGVAFEATGAYIWILLFSTVLMALASLAAALLPKYPNLR